MSQPLSVQSLQRPPGGRWVQVHGRTAIELSTAVSRIDANGKTKTKPVTLGTYDSLGDAWLAYEAATARKRDLAAAAGGTLIWTGNKVGRLWEGDTNGRMVSSPLPDSDAQTLQDSHSQTQTPCLCRSRLSSKRPLTWPRTEGSTQPRLHAPEGRWKIWTRMTCLR